MQGCEDRKHDLRPTTFSARITNVLTLIKKPFYALMFALKKERNLFV